MFWGIKLNGPKNMAAFSSEKLIRLVNVALEPPTPEMPLHQKVQLFMVRDDKEFLVATLDRDRLNAFVDTILDPKDTVCFRIKGAGVVHLTGFEEDDFGSDSGSETSTDIEETAQHFKGLKIASGGGFLSGEPKFG